MTHRSEVVEMERFTKSCLLVVLVFFVTLAALGSARAVSVRIRTSNGASACATYYTQDGDRAHGDAWFPPGGSIALRTRGSAEKGLVRAESGGGQRDFSPYTGDFSASATASGGGAATSASYANERVDIFVVSQGGNESTGNFAGPIYGTIQDAVVGSSGGDDPDGARADWILVGQGTGANPYTEQVGINNFEADSALTTVWGPNDTIIDRGGAAGNSVDVNNSPGFLVEGFTVTDAGDIGINVDQSDGAQIVCNTVTNSGDEGIRVQDSAGAVIRENTVTNAVDEAIEVETSAGTQITDNTVTDSGQGIRVRNSPGAQVTDNDVTDIDFLGILVQNDPLLGGGEVIDRNRVTNTGNHGIFAQYSDNIGITNNTVNTTRNSQGIFVFESAGAQVTDNDVRNTDDQGIDISTCANARIIDNDLTNIGRHGIRVQNSANAEIDENTINTTRNNQGIRVVDSTGARITDNIFTSPDDEGIDVLRSDNAVIDENTITDSGQGIRVRNSPGAQVTDNDVTNTDFLGIYVQNDPLLGGGEVIDRNRVTNTGNHGIYVQYSDNVPITNNTVNTTRDDQGIFVFDSDGAQVTDNNVTNTDEQGIYVQESSNAQISDNDVTNSQEDGITLWNSDDAQVTNNTVANNLENGIWIRGSNNAQIGDPADDTLFNDITGNGLAPGDHAGVLVSAGSTGVQINRNNIQGNPDYGLWNSSGNAVDAENNYWGAGDGPSGTGPGSGDAIQDTGAGSTTDFDPWAAGPF